MEQLIPAAIEGRVRLPHDDLTDEMPESHVDQGEERVGHDSFPHFLAPTDAA